MLIIQLVSKINLLPNIIQSEYWPKKGKCDYAPVRVMFLIRVILLTILSAIPLRI